jgi:hypothetical protein
MRGSMSKVALAVLGALIVAGCGTTAPPYAVSIDNVETLKRAGTGPAKVGAFTAPPGLDTIHLRANYMTSPIGGSYGAYLADAIRQEFALAKLLDENSAVEISGALLKNDVDIGGFVSGSAVVEARVVVKKDGQIRYDKVMSAATNFDSHFVGAIAIPRGAQNYPLVVQKFLAALYADPDFIAALK